MIADRELRQWLNDHCNGTLDEASAALLDRRLASDAAARQQYAEWMAVEAALNRSCGECTPRVEVPVDPNVAVATVAQRAGGARWAAMLVIAASLVAVALSSSLLTRLWIGGDSTRPISSSVKQPGEAPLARITSTLNCRWKQPARGAGFGTKLCAGDQLDLEAGLAEVTFESGVQIILEGPATLDLRDATEAILVDGRLAASIPSEARQPRLRVERFVAFEPGSEFGLMADSSGGGEVHVFSGRVSASLINELGETLETMRLSKSEGVRVSPAARTMTKVTADGDQFVRSLSPTSGPHDGLYLQEAFDYLDGPLAMQNGGFGWAGPWEDIEAAATANQKATNRVARTSLEAEGMVSSGGRAVQLAQRNRVRRALSTSIGGVFDAAGLVENRDGHRLIGQSGRTVYVSFLQRVDKLDDVFYGFELHRGDGNGNRVLCIGNGAEGAAYGVTSNYNNYVEENYPPLGEEDTETNLLVIRIDYGADDRDFARVYRNPLSLTDETECLVSAELTGNFAFDRISLGNFDGSKIHEIDEIRVGTSYRAVLGQRDRFHNDLVRRFAASDVLKSPRKASTYSYLFMPMVFGVCAH
jgi:hypothetical protein